MSASPPDPVPRRPALESDSRDCTDIVFDLYADNIVRPCEPYMLPHLQAARDRIARGQEWQKQQDAAKTPPKESESGNGSS